VPVIWTIGNHEMEGSPFGSYCNETVFCEGRFLNQTDGYAVAGGEIGPSVPRALPCALA
jgi:hypothetical protein